MPRVPLTSPATGNPTSSSFIHTTACHFVDNAGRTLILRGVNLSGSSKAPVGRPSYIREGFWEEAEAGSQNFIGHPLNMEDGSADVHLARLRGWGFNMLRFPVTWEALEHAGPGKYDYEFIDYIIRVLHKCKAYGFKVFMDPHQDIWSRFSGGSGAPFWTIAACGIDPRNLTATQSAIIHCEYPLAHIADPATLPAMIWTTNYGRLLSQTIFTFFFAGRDFAPHCVIDGMNIQDYLQHHFIEAFGTLADRIRDAGDLLDECVLGWDSLNEPFEGLCGWDNLSVNPTMQSSTLKKGTYPTPAQSLRLGMGQAQTVENWSFGSLGPKRDGSVTIDPKGIKIWADPSTETPDGVNERWGWKRDVSQWKLGTCVWAQHGVWDIESGYILRDDYFRYLPSTGNPAEFVEDYWKPHFVRYATRVRRAHPEAILFVQPPVFAPPPKLEEEGLLKGRCAYSAHYYDGLTLITRHWNWFNADALGLLRGHYATPLQAVKIGEGAIRRSFQEQLAMLKKDTTIIGPYPTLIGEIGTPFDMDGKRSYGWTDKGKYRGDYNRQEKALDASLNGADGSNGLNWTVWTYCTDNTHDWGDGWNMEDLSLWCADDLPDAEEQDVDSPNSNDGDPSALYDPMVAGSRAGLLNNQSKVAMVNNHAPKRQTGTETPTLGAAAASSLSLASLGSMSLPEKYQSLQRQPRLEDWTSDPYGFLTSGARAVRAFSRPWPTKIVGVPADIKFDIGKAFFKLVVRVTAEDAPPAGVLDNEDAAVDEEKGARSRATEIYVPLIHFGAEDVVRLDSPEGQTGTRQSGDEGGAVVSRGRSSAVGSRWASAVDLPASTDTDEAVVDLVAQRGLLDVTVKVSSGRWRVEGQTLRWWYDVPKAGEGTKEYTIEIKRRTGVIKPLLVARGARRRSKSWCELLCQDRGCCIM
ncbi:hypothetical protein C0991_011523 [Blastosporella zonata]|nr:hypothetical protein C0991_011523 [Blastosporella zonata]